MAQKSAGGNPGGVAKKEVTRPLSNSREAAEARPIAARSRARAATSEARLTMAEPQEPGGADERRTHLSAEEARGGQIILRTRAMRIIFIAGLVAFAVFAIALSY